MLTFIRHAESLANAGGQTMPNGSIPLSARGLQQAQDLAPLLAASLDGLPGTVLVSAFLRTQETARPFCQKIKVSPQQQTLLNEFSLLDPGLIAGMNLAQRRPVSDAYWRAADPDKQMGEAAESFHAFAARVESFAQTLNDLPDGTVIFGHGIWLAMLVWRLLGFSAQGSRAMHDFHQFLQALPMPNCAVYSLECSTRGNWSARYNANLSSKTSI